MSIKRWLQANRVVCKLLVSSSALASAGLVCKAQTSSSDPILCPLITAVPIPTNNNADLKVELVPFVPAVQAPPVPNKVSKVIVNGTLAASAPTKEYIRWNGQVVVIENKQ